MGITRNAMENLGFLPFCCMAEKINLNRFKWLQGDLNVMRDEPFLSPRTANQQFF
jgi:hypothetical protein